jgi:hypothetical protein
VQSHAWLYAAAAYNLAWAVFHLGFWRIFRWSEELPKLHAVNRGVMQVLNIMLTFVFLMLTALLVLHAGEVTGSRLGRSVLAGMMVFWILRAILQPIFWPALPKATNGAFVFLFVIGAGLHAMAYQPH